ncbi:DUF4373 domain-containing protein [Eubacterium maltosivorans]|uniref:DUF4373 domain-containing protein n=1 Tax=Eubacterium maltosivorans TaxID=2041044 RepID=UPI00189D9D6F|nr:DUF4373 domain-containing protein [Eubacterium maltosivorans]
MTRPFKQGIDYFPFDLDLLSDRKLRRPKNKHGYLAIVVYIALLCLIYKDKGYYLDYSEYTREDVQWDILEFLQGKFQPTTETVGEVIEDLVACGLFSRDLFSKNIISSHRLQCVFYKTTVDRKSVNIDWNIWLLDETEMRELSSRHTILNNFINRPKNEVNPPNNLINPPNNPQSKVNKSKQKESKKNKPAAAVYFDNPELNQLFLEYLDIRKVIKAVNTERAVTLLLNKLRPYDDAVKKAAIEAAITGSWKSVYPESITKNSKGQKSKRNGEIQISDDRKKVYEELDRIDEERFWRDEDDNSKN